MPIAGTAPTNQFVGTDAVPVLQASAAQVASGTGTAAVPDANPAKAWIFQLVVSAAATGAGDTLNVYVQQSHDGGDNWDDLVSFPQVLGNSAEGVYVATVPVVRDDQAGEVHARTDGALAAGSVRATVIGRRFRVKWTIAGGTAAFTFGVYAAPR